MSYLFIEAYYINLYECHERNKGIRHELLNNNIRPIRVNAVDGNDWELISTQSEKRLFRDNDYNENTSKEKIMACALSHIRLLRRLLIEKKDYYVICEDDFIFKTNGAKSIVNTLIELQDKDWDIVFFPYNDNDINPDNNIVYINEPKWLSSGTVLYIINGISLEKWCKYINNGLNRAIDWFYIDAIRDGFNIFLGPSIIRLGDYSTTIR